MQLVEKHIVTKNSPLFKECDRICFASKNIYNRSIYLIKQDWNDNHSYNTLNNLYDVIKVEECYSQLPTKVAQQTIRLVQSVYKSFFRLLKAKKEGKLDADIEVNEPKYLNKKYGRQVATFTSQSISKKVFEKAHKVKLSQCDIEVPTAIEKFSDIACTRIVPKLDSYVIEIVYNVEDVAQLPSNRQYAAIDLGVNNLATITSNKKGFQPRIINGRPLKSTNQYYNKNLARFKGKLDKQKSKYKSSHRIKRLTNKRNNKVNDYLHKASKKVVDLLVSEDIHTLIVGKNDSWKEGTKMGNMNNQNFVQIPHSRFINMLKYKCERAGIRMVLVEESYTSQSSFMNLDPLPKYGDEIIPIFSGYREKRGLYNVKKSKIRINADVNGSYNILRKAIPSAFAKGIEGLVVNPYTIAV